MPWIGQRVVVLRRARREVRHVADWYHKQNPQAAAGFESAFEAALGVLAEAPLRWAEVTPGVRRYLLLGYPYTLAYTVRDAQVLILSVVHHARHPDTWRRDR